MPELQDHEGKNSLNQDVSNTNLKYPGKLTGFILGFVIGFGILYSLSMLTANKTGIIYRSAFWGLITLLVGIFITLLFIKTDRKAIIWGIVIVFLLPIVCSALFIGACSLGIIHPGF